MSRYFGYGMVHTETMLSLLNIIFFNVCRYGGRCPGANFTELPSNTSTVLDETAHAALNPSSEFPAFLAPEDGTVRLTSPQMGFFTTGGVMNYGAMAHGTGLRCSTERVANGAHCTGYSGGARGGPLVLFDVNTTRGGDVRPLHATALRHSSPPFVVQWEYFHLPAVLFHADTTRTVKTKMYWKFENADEVVRSNTVQFCECCSN